MSRPDFDLVLLALLILMQLGVALHARRTEGSWFSPGAAFATFWLIMGAAPTLAIGLFPITPGAMAVVLTFTVSVYVGSQFATASRHRSRVPGRQADQDQSATAASSSNPCPRAWLFAVLLGLASIPAAMSFLGAAGVSLSSLSSLTGWVQAAARLTVARYAEGFVEPLTARGGMALVYAGSLFGGVALAFGPNRWAKSTVVVPILGGLVVGLLTTMKLVLMLPFILAGATYLVCRLSRSTASSSKVGLLEFARAGLAVAVAFAAILGAMSARYSEATSLATVLMTKLATYALGHMSALSAWVDRGGLWVGELKWGSLTFGGVYAFAGFGSRQPGLYDLVWTNDYTINSNVFTAFRGLVEDFSLPVALALMSFTGWISGMAYAKVRNQNRPSGWWAVLAGFYVLVAWSFVTSIFTYNSVIAAFAIFFCYCAWPGRRPAT
ncbi:MAG TPA: O-antigen polymerase [Steroidobacteraceae bacterium]|nr:O-antigen polymerase [Steroidobacteraceae bacterium]